MPDPPEDLPLQLWEQVKKKLKGNEIEKLDAIETLAGRNFRVPDYAFEHILELARADQPEKVRIRLASVLNDGRIPMGFYVQLAEALDNDPSEDVQQQLERYRERTRKLHEAMGSAFDSATRISSIAYGSISKWAETFRNLTVSPVFQDALRVSEIYTELFSRQGAMGLQLATVQKRMGLVGKDLMPFLEATRLANRMMSVPAFPTLGFYPLQELEEVEEPLKEPPTQRGKELASKLASTPSGHDGWMLYQEVCEEILSHCLVPPLLEPHSQSRTSQGLQIRDLIFHIPHEIGEFWLWVKLRFDSIALIVEAKNYSQPLEGNEIVISSKYLSGDRLGRLGLVISRKGFGRGATGEQKRIWNRDKTLILGLSDSHLLKMLELRDEGEDPEKVIDAEIRRFLEELE